jgi:membrane protein YqaA with SNARE-associated domain
MAMDDAQLAGLVFGVATVTFVAGMLAGYAIGAAISHYHSASAQRRRLRDSWQSSGSTELKEIT